MSEPFMGQVVAVGFSYAPVGWLPCDGRLLQISQYDALFSLLGVQYGGDGIATFALPDLRGRVIVGTGQGPSLPNYVAGNSGGAEQVQLASNQIGAHSHALQGANNNNSANPASNYALGTGGTGNLFYSPPDATQTSLSLNTISAVGGTAPHENRQPFTCINYIICVEGIYPSPG